MALLRAQVEIAMTTGVTADKSVNVLHFQDLTDSDEQTVFDNVEAFYQDIVSLYSDNVAQNGHVIKIYNVDDPTPRAPILEDTFDFTGAPSGAPLPHQCSMVLSFQGVRFSGSPQARRRGRIYLGPLDTSSIDTDGRLATGRINTVLSAATTLVDAAGPRWMVYSPTNQDATEVNNGWIDNAVDIQRRRQRETTTRSTFTAT